MTASTSTHPRYIDDGYVRLVSVIGNGAYGVVFYAIDYRYGVPIKRAVKQLRRHGVDERQRRFQMREINLHRRASSHPSIIHMDRLIEEHDCVYVVMDYGDEGDLFAMITEKQRYAGDNELVRSVFLQILDGVDWLHNIGIAHRDVKPENIVCSADGTRVRIVDFGLATSEHSSTEFGCGSTFYIAPECLGELAGQAPSYATRSADVWSLGVILVNLVCGRNPWRCASPTDESFSTFLRDPTFLRRILPISDACLMILCQIFTFDPASRITTDRLRELILEIDSFTDNVHPTVNRNVAVKQQVVNQQQHVKQQHQVVIAPVPVYDDCYYAESPDAEPVFSFDDLEGSDELPSLREDTSSPIPEQSSSDSSDGPFPPTPKLSTSSHQPHVASVSSLTPPVFESFSNRKGARMSPVPFATPAMFL